jgi:hypothetical protein
MEVFKVKNWKEMTRNRKEWNKLVQKAKTHTPGCSAAEEEEEEEVRLTDPDVSENREAFIVQDSVSLKTDAKWNFQNVGMCQITYTASRPRRRVLKVRWRNLDFSLKSLQVLPKQRYTHI